jgi:hypothetical protein
MAPGNFNRATSPVELAGLGDPERWGAYGEASVFVPFGSGTFTGVGPQMVRAQVPDLLARSWVIVASFQATGLSVNGVDPDVPEYFLEVAFGVGMTSTRSRLDLIRLAGSSAWWTSTTNSAGKVIAGLAQLPTPLPATALAISPGVSITHAGGIPGNPSHTVTVGFNVSVAPWSLA